MGSHILGGMNCARKFRIGVEEIVRWQRTVDVLEEKLVQFPAYTWWLTIPFSSVLGNYTPFSCLHTPPHGSHTHTQTNTNIYTYIYVLKCLRMRQGYYCKAESILWFIYFPPINGNNMLTEKIMKCLLALPKICIFSWQFVKYAGR